MSSLTIDDVGGTWRIVRTEIPEPFKPVEEFFHLFPDGLCINEHPFWAQKNKAFRFRYELTEFGARLETIAGKAFTEWKLRLEGELLVLTARHGYTSWLQRIPPGERPEFLSEYCEPPGQAQATT